MLAAISNRMKFVPFGENTELSVSYSIVDENDNEIGFVEGHANKYGELVSVVKIYAPEQQRHGLGFEAFKKVHDELNENVEIKMLVGSWHAGGEFQDFEGGMSTNLMIFFEALESGKTAVESAFTTPTGKWAKKLGYTKCEVPHISKDDMSVKFTKKDNNS